MSNGHQPDPQGVSPASTGPAGPHFEAQVGASYLLAMLTGGEPRGLPGMVIRSDRAAARQRETPRRPSRGDRHFAGLLHEQRVPLRVVFAAFVLAIARRKVRSADLPPLPAIRTLRFFQGAIDEVLQTGLDPAYVHSLAAKIKPLVAEKDEALHSHLDDPSDSRVS